MEQNNDVVYIGRRGGTVVGFWRQRPVAMDVKKEDRVQDEDIDFEEVPYDAPEVEAFLTRPIAPRARTVEEKLAAVGLTVAELKDVINVRQGSP